jgi:hypothetical protein
VDNNNCCVLEKKEDRKGKRDGEENRNRKEFTSEIQGKVKVD